MLWRSSFQELDYQISFGSFAPVSVVLSPRCFPEWKSPPKCKYEAQVFLIGLWKTKSRSFFVHANRFLCPETRFSFKTVFSLSSPWTRSRGPLCSWAVLPHFSTILKVLGKFLSAHLVLGKFFYPTFAKMLRYWASFHYYRWPNTLNKFF